MIIDFESGALGVVETSFVSTSSPFALEVYGAEGAILVGGPDDGVWRSVDGAAPTRFSEEPVDCLRWSDGSLWACRAFVPGGALLLRSDGEAPFVTALSAADVGGPPPRCPAGTLSHDVCPGRWSVVRRSLVPPTPLDASTDRGAVIAPTPPSDCGCHAGSAPGGPGVALMGLLLSASRRRRRPLRRASPAASS